MQIKIFSSHDEDSVVERFNRWQRTLNGEVKAVHFSTCYGGTMHYSICVEYEEG